MGHHVHRRRVKKWVNHSIDADSSGFVDFGEFAIYWHNRPGTGREQPLGMKYHAFMSHCQGDASGTVSTTWCVVAG